MTAFVIANIDAIISIAIGLFFVVSAATAKPPSPFARPWFGTLAAVVVVGGVVRLAVSKTGDPLDKFGFIMTSLGILFVFRSSAGQRLHPRLAPIMGILAAFMLLIGLAALGIPRLGESSHEGNPGIQRTYDGVAQAQFPVKPNRTRPGPDESVPDAPVETYILRGSGGLELALERRQMGEGVDTSDSDFFDRLLTGFELEGYSPERIGSTSVNGREMHLLVLSAPNRQATVSLRVAFVGSQAYLVVATIPAGSSANTSVQSFLESIQINDPD